MSAGHLSNLLIKNYSDNEREKTEIYLEGRFVQPLAAFWPIGVPALAESTTPIKWKNALKLLPQETVFSSTQFETLQEYVFAQTR